jgi:two-component system chemotaxis response regulator CheB
MAARIRVITHPRARLGVLGHPPSARPALPASAQGARYRLVALGASTGGPSALVEVLRAIRPRTPVPILVVLHIGEPFGVAFAQWLDSQTAHHVAHARDGESLDTLGGRVTMAPPGRHLVVQSQRLRLTSDPERHWCRPSVDVLFESLARDCGSSTLACLLTGMGRDGAAGLLQISRAGGFTIAQDEVTSVVYGMPREAAAIGAAQRVLPLPEIGGTIAHLVGGG